MTPNMLEVFVFAMPVTALSVVPWFVTVVFKVLRSVVCVFTSVCKAPIKATLFETVVAAALFWTTELVVSRSDWLALPLTVVWRVVKSLCEAFVAMLACAEATVV